MERLSRHVCNFLHCYIEIYSNYVLIVWVEPSFQDLLTLTCISHTVHSNCKFNCSCVITTMVWHPMLSLPVLTNRLKINIFHFWTMTCRSCILERISGQWIHARQWPQVGILTANKKPCFQASSIISEWWEDSSLFFFFFFKNLHESWWFLMRGKIRLSCLGL